MFSRRFFVSSCVLTLVLFGFAPMGNAQALTAQTDNGALIIPSGIPTDVPCPLIISGILGSGSATWPSTSGTQTGRLNRNGIASTCAVPKTCNQWDTTPGRAYDAYSFTNGTGVTACVVGELEVITQTACNIQMNAYLNTYDPANICTGYLADPGISSGTPPSLVGPFSFDVPANDELILVVHTTNPGEIDCEYTITMSGDCIPVELQSLTVE
jgi:hypothetical protein